MPNKAQDDDLVISLVELALRCPSTERAAYLQRACGDDTELFFEVRKYVEMEERMGNFLSDRFFRRLF